MGSALDDRVFGEGKLKLEGRNPYLCIKPWPGAATLSFLQRHTYSESEYSIDPIGVPAFPDWSGIFAAASALSRIGIPTVRTAELIK